MTAGGARGVVVVGGGQAAAVTARSLRRRGYDRPVTIIGDENHRPYQRPPLSKEYLLKGDGDALPLLPPEWTSAHGVEVRTGTRVVRIRPADAAVEIDDGTLVPADDVVLATGGRPRRLPGAAGDRIRYLRRKEDADGLRADLGPSVRLVVIGSGFIGAEVASTARQLGADVVVLEALSAPLLRLVGPQLATSCARWFREAGVDLRLGVHVEQVRQHGAEVVVDTDAGQVTGDLVVIGIGIEPNDEVARHSGLAVDNGVLVDEYCRTSVEHVHAAGDVANHQHPLFGRRMRVEHFDNASKQAAAVASNIAGRTTVYDDPHWFWSDQFGVNLQHVGLAAHGAAVVVRGDPESDEWSAFFLAAGALRGAVGVNRAEDVLVAKELIAAERTVAPEQLTDPDLDLMELLEEPQ